MNRIEAILLGGALVTLLVGAILDFRTHRIPNSLTFGSAILGFAANLAMKQIPGAGQR
jgi:prepilin signal peptidase PulO-like enzyme (type II secretory pathway)